MTDWEGVGFFSVRAVCFLIVFCIAVTVLRRKRNGS